MCAIYYRTVVHVYDQLQDGRVCTVLSLMYAINYRTVVHVCDQLHDSRLCMYTINYKTVVHGNDYGLQDSRSITG